VRFIDLDHDVAAEGLDEHARHAGGGRHLRRRSQSEEDHREGEHSFHAMPAAATGQGEGCAGGAARGILAPMSIKPDRWIRRMAREHRMIEPFTDKQVREGVISYGVSSYGYDVRIADEFKIFTNINSTIVDPKNFDPRSFVDFKGDVCIIPPNSFALAQTVEYFRIPRNVLTICVGKSTYARCGIIVNVTPFEPEWEGIVTLEVSNTTPLPAKIYANEGIAQVLFFESDEECETSYADKKGKYQAQKKLTLPRL
jgi:dCTP deaminase